MIFQNIKTLSLLPKLVFIIILAASILLASYLMFVDYELIITSLQKYKLTGNYSRQIIIVTCSLVYLARVIFMMFAFLHRKFFFREALTVTVIMSLVLFFLGYTAGSNNSAINFLDIAGLFLYFIGSFISTWSEYQRNKWKKNPENKNKLYTSGWFQYSRNINYFADIILFSGFALITQKLSMQLIPLFMTLNFILILIPSKERYLQKKYGIVFQNYTKNTKRVIPFIY
jgi:steroid 5-alpha reductase family enzyme